MADEKVSDAIGAMEVKRAARALARSRGGGYDAADVANEETILAYVDQSEAALTAAREQVARLEERPWPCVECSGDPDGVGPGCSCAHAPCIHDRNGTIVKLESALARSEARAAALDKRWNDLAYEVGVERNPDLLPDAVKAIQESAASWRALCFTARDEGAAKEREECALECDEVSRTASFYFQADAFYFQADGARHYASKECATRIRARSVKTPPTVACSICDGKGWVASDEPYMGMQGEACALCSGTGKQATLDDALPTTGERGGGKSG